MRSARLSLAKVLMWLLLGYVLMLPLSRPTIAFAQMGSKWKFALFPDRYAENISRFPQPQKARIPLKPLSSRLPTPFHYSTNEEWQRAYIEGNVIRRIQLFRQLRGERNSALLDQAIENLEGPHELLVIESVRYLRAISGRLIGNEREQWREWRRSTAGRLRIGNESRNTSNVILQRGYSAVQVVDDLELAKKTGQEFLTVYLKHFPVDAGPAEIMLLEQSIGAMKGSGAPYHFRRGMLYLFLALTRTKTVAADQLQEAEAAANSWNSSLGNFREAGAAGIDLSEEIARILRRADANANESLDPEEVRKMLVPYQK